MTNTERQIQRDRYRQIQTDKQADSCTTVTNTERQRQTDKQTYRYRQTDRQIAALQ